MYDLIEETFWQWSIGLIPMIMPIIAIRIVFEFISDLIFQRG